MKYQYKEIKLEQGTTEWKKWRKGGFGASDIPTLMGENPWKSISKLLEEKNGYGGDFTNAAMRRGTILKPEAREKYCEVIGFEVNPICIQHNDYFWARASLDGISEDRNHIVEIKCGESAYKKALFGEVPKYYYGQLQHILFITGLNIIDYWCYLPDVKGILIKVKKDDSYINNLIITCEKYKEYLDQ